MPNCIRSSAASPWARRMAAWTAPLPAAPSSSSPCRRSSTVSSRKREEAAMTTMRVADYIMERLVQAGVRHVFQVTGRGALFLNDGLAKHPGLEAVSLHHEQSCAFAAVAYAQQTDALGACLVSTG